MRIRFLGHACFHLETAAGLSILIDPYEPNGLGGLLRYSPLPVAPDLVLLTHEHSDHADCSWVVGHPEIVRGPWVRRGLEVGLHHAAHDELGGNLRSGHVRLFSVRADGVHVLHCGDLGERLLPDRLAKLSPVDALLVPVGGYFTLGPAGAAELARALETAWVVPCHYRTAAAPLPQLQPLSAFLRRFGHSRLPGRVAPAALELDPAAQPPVRPTVVPLVPLGMAPNRGAP